MAVKLLFPHRLRLTLKINCTTHLSHLKILWGSTMFAETNFFFHSFWRWGQVVDGVVRFFKGLWNTCDRVWFPLKLQPHLNSWNFHDTTQTNLLMRRYSYWRKEKSAYLASQNLYGHHWPWAVTSVFCDFVFVLVPPLDVYPLVFVPLVSVIWIW